MNTTRSFPPGAVTLLVLAIATGAAHAAPVIDDIAPARQRVHERIRLSGTGFGSFAPGVSGVRFTAQDGAAVVAVAPYVWRDDFIEIRVPVGAASGAAPGGIVAISVLTADGSSPAATLAVPRAQGKTLDFVQKSRLDNDLDRSGFLGGAMTNMARTKDAEIGDVNGDGYPDLIDNNSNNLSNNTHSILRLNRRGLFFAPADWEPVSATDPGPFVVQIGPDGFFAGDTVAYDADFVDLTNDGLPDWVQAASGAKVAVRIAINTSTNGVPGFVEDTATWFPAPDFPNGSPDDIAHTDVNQDGFVDIAAAFRFSNRVQIYLNEGGTTFGPTIEIEWIASASIHDVFFLEANGDGFPDAVLVNESGNSAVFFNDGDRTSPSFRPGALLPLSAFAGTAADMNGDGLDDIVLSGDGQASVFLNDPASPGSFSEIPLTDPVLNLYDLEAGDIDLDGDVDLAGAAIVTQPDNTARIWLNDGTGNFTNATSPGASALLPGIGPYQRLSADLIDADLDGDLDLYLTGADSTGVFGFGQVPNQYWENRIRGISLAVAGSCPGPATLTGKGASPASGVLFVVGTSPGLTVLGAGPCAGIRVGVQNPSPFGGATADTSGQFAGVRNLTAAQCGAVVEAIDLATCRATTVSRLPTEGAR